MSRQGKLHSAPFHIESAQYKYAIEHEELPPQETGTVYCQYYKAQFCTLWNSGMQRCMSHRCKYLHEDSQREDFCNTCAYFCEGNCQNQKRSTKKVNWKSAQYCCYYLSIDKDPNQFKRIQYAIQKRLIDDAIARRQKSIKGIRKHIHYTSNQLKSGQLNEAEETFCRDKLNHQIASLHRHQAQLKSEQEKMAQLQQRMNTEMDPQSLKRRKK